MPHAMSDSLNWNQFEASREVGFTAPSLDESPWSHCRIWVSSFEAAEIVPPYMLVESELHFSGTHATRSSGAAAAARTQARNAARMAAAAQAAAATRAAAAARAAAPPLEQARMFRTAEADTASSAAVPALEILQAAPASIDFRFVSLST